MFCAGLSAILYDGGNIQFESTFCTSCPRDKRQEPWQQKKKKKKRPTSKPKGWWTLAVAWCQLWTSVNMGASLGVTCHYISKKTASCMRLAVTKIPSVSHSRKPQWKGALNQQGLEIHFSHWESNSYYSTQSLNLSPKTLEATAELRDTHEQENSF